MLKIGDMFNMAWRKNKSKRNISNRRKAFSAFSQSYSGGLNGNQQSYSEKMRRRNMIKLVLIIFGIIAIFIFAFVFTDVMLNISQRPVETTSAFIFFKLPSL